jgi:predicted enzyme related to lactoylglutathione lyase
MKRLVTTSIFFITIIAACQPANQKTTNMEEQKNEKTIAAKDTTPKVTGVGGIFFFSENPKETREWYRKNLGIDANDYGATFESRNLNNPEQVDALQWSPFKQGSEYFAPSKKEFMINYRVQNIEALVHNLKENGVTVLDKIENSDYGKFVHIMDAEGNKIELWEPAEESSEKTAE